MRRYFFCILMLALVGCDGAPPKGPSSNTETEIVRGINGSQEETVTLISQSDSEVIVEATEQIAAANYHCNSVINLWKISFEDKTGATFLKARCSDNSNYQITLFQGRGFVKPWNGTLLGQ